MPTKSVTTVKKTPTKAVPEKAPAKVNPARELKVLKAFTVAWDDPEVLAKIAAAFDKHGKVAVTAQGDKALDRKQQQRVQSIGYRRGYNLNLATAVTATHVIACPRNPDAPKSEIQAPATPRAPKAEKTPAKTTRGQKVAADIVSKIVADPKAKAAVEKAAKVVGKTPAGKTRKATPRRRTDAQAAYDRTTFGQDAPEAVVDAVADQAQTDQEAQAQAIEKLKAERLAAKEAEAADSDPLTVPADLQAALDANLAADQERTALVAAGVLDVGNAIIALDPPLDPEAGLRVGVRGKDPVIETNYGVALGRPFKDRAIAVDVLAELAVLRAQAETDAA